MNNNQFSQNNSELTVDATIPRSEQYSMGQDYGRKRKNILPIIIIILIIIIAVITILINQFKTKTVSEEAKTRDTQRAQDVGKIAGYTLAFKQKNGRCPSTPDELKTSYIDSIPVDPLTKKSYKITSSGSSCIVSAEMEDKDNLLLKFDSTPNDSVYTMSVN
ncbi:MAG: hypothetical protein WC536_01230 [Patescibacteria group bacterium]|jgi:cytoskeletal protein RodZ